MYGIYVLRRATHGGYDTYSSCVVVARDESEAKLIHPAGDEPAGWWNTMDEWAEWVHPDAVECTKVGTTDTEVPGTVLCSRFHAG